MTNAAPTIFWHSHTMACGIKRQRLYINNNETPYFIDGSEHRAHRTYGEKYGLYGSGMHPAGIAATLGCSSTIAILKHRAEQMALNAI